MSDVSAEVNVCFQNVEQPAPGLTGSPDECGGRPGQDSSNCLFHLVCSFNQLLTFLCLRVVELIIILNSRNSGYDLTDSFNVLGTIHAAGMMIGHHNMDGYVVFK